MIYADIIIDISSDKLDRSFQYRVPERLEKKIKAGMVAAIPFGNAGRVRKGYVIGLSDKPKIAPEKIKEISEICSGEETTESRLIALAVWMRENYGSTMIQALRTVLPIQEKIKAKEKKYICLDISEEAGTQLLKELEQTRFKARTRLLRELLKKKRLDYTHAAKELGTTSAVVKKFQEQGIIRIEYDEIMRTSLNTGDISGERRMPLTDEQEAAVKQIQRVEKPIAEACTDRGSDRERENPGVYKADRADAFSGKRSNRVDPGDCSDISDGTQILCQIWG